MYEYQFINFNKHRIPMQDVDKGGNGALGKEEGVYGMETVLTVKLKLL